MKNLVKISKLRMMKFKNFRLRFLNNNLKQQNILMISNRKVYKVDFLIKSR